jgi:hypothetical protein
MAATGKPCATCGMTRDFSSILHLDFDTTRLINKLSVSVFLFFFIQLVARLLLSFFWKKIPEHKISFVQKTDTVFSIILFAVTFYKLIL